MERRQALLTHVGVQFITHHNDRYSYLDAARLALEGGCRWIQLRMKDASDDEAESVARQVQALCRWHGAAFLIDDRVEMVKKLRADGVHLGKNDMPISAARQLLGDDYLIGGTANTFEDVATHAKAGADYIGCGPFRFTTTKQNLSPVLGLEGYSAICDKMRAAGIHLPIVAIGGITPSDIPDILATGVTGIAVSGSVLRADDPVEAMREIMQAYHTNQNTTKIIWKN